MSPDHGAMVPAHGAGQIGVVVGGTVWDEVKDHAGAAAPRTVLFVLNKSKLRPSVKVRLPAQPRSAGTRSGTV